MTMPQYDKNKYIKCDIWKYIDYVINENYDEENDVD